ncbi:MULTISPECIES: FAS1-like dehydratase domain-containing protein [unclassified Nocardioides]|uniref:FAS1-like dehydratase domain-containing protein n=1 Tax=unclassified Nocardioides TaxID=2615069 RepID=UPI0009EFAAC5|nr:MULTISPECIES: MaoC family dehydratase N-terminal domain-containing protein [unclassified Nocardioides]GAW48955.1 uncharacterized protein PD653B2_1274 [Nocardioides sp. PD653-B2]GAW55170.1 uncharacterized protein PD653_2589 [Nocardioides sp. PD653]
MTDVSERDGILEPWPAQALAALIDVPEPSDVLPLGWHWIYLLEHPRQEDIGADGHPLHNTVPAPPRPGLRRMWAGGRLTYYGELRIGEHTTRRSTLTSLTEKQGRSGPLTFAKVEHALSQHGEVKLVEHQDLVYRPIAPVADSGDHVSDGPDDAFTPRPLGLAAHERAIPVSETLLFRFSALTYNAHRIHYDRDYATKIEGYPDLVTHGPLQALIMAETARAAGLQTVTGLCFEYRLLAPLFLSQGMIAGASTSSSGVQTYVRDYTGRQTATGSITSR